MTLHDTPPSPVARDVGSGHAPVAGARNLLLDCAGIRPGEAVLIAYESSAHGHFDDDLLPVIEKEARALGARVTRLDVGFDRVHADLPQALLDQLARNDVVVFLSRLGDQMRFSDLPAGPRFVVCFAFNAMLLGSAFGTARYQAFCEAKALVDQRLFAAREITITCPAGTHVTGQVAATERVPRDTTVTRFPMSVFSPVPAAHFSGRVALGGFLTGTGSRYYDDYTIGFDAQVFALLDQGRLVGFEGTASDVAKADAQYDRVAAMFGLDRNAVHSWHAGIHPGCGFPWDLRAHDTQWGGAAFGNPRILHFHTCGTDAPGEISWNVFDTTISVDNVDLWDKGRFHLERLQGGADILNRYPCVARIFADPIRDVGLGDVS